MAFLIIFLGRPILDPKFPLMPVTNEHLQYALFSSNPTIFEEAVKDAQWVQANEKVNNEVAVIDKHHQDVNALQEKLKYIHIFSNKNLQCAGKDDN